MPNPNAVPLDDLPVATVPANDLPSAPHGNVVPPDDLPSVEHIRAPAPATGPQLTGLDKKIEDAANRHGLDPRVFRNLVQTESSFDPKQVSSAGAVGLTQLMPGTAKEMGVKDPHDPDQNLEGGAKYLKQLLDHYNGNYQLALTAYNAGPGNVDKKGLDARHAEGADPDYFSKILKNIQPALAAAHVPQVANTLFGKSGALREMTKNVNHVGQAIAAPAMAGMKYLDAVLGAPERVVEGMLNKHASSKEVGWSGADVLHGLGVAFHPMDDAMQSRENKQLVDRDLSILGLPTNSTGAVRLLEEIGVQSAHDPLSFLGVTDALRMGGVVAKVLKAGSQTAMSVPSVAKLVTQLGDASQKMGLKQLQDAHKAMMTARPELNPFLTPIAKGARLSIEQRNETQFSHIQQMDRAIMSKFPEVAKAKDLSDITNHDALAAIQHRNDFDVWAFGDTALRQEAVKNGFVPTAAEAKMFPQPAGVLRFGAADYLKDYEPLMRTAAQKAASRVAAGVEYTPLEQEYFNRYGDRGLAGFEKLRKTAAGTPQSVPFGERIAYRWNAGREYAKRRLVDEETKQFLQAHPTEWKGPAGLTDEQQLGKLTHEPNPVFPVSSPLHALMDNPLTKTTRALAARGISGNPFPHGLKNVGMLAYIDGGPQVFFGGLARAVGIGSRAVGAKAGASIEGTTQVMDRMSRLGLLTNYDVDKTAGIAAGLYNVPGLKQLDKAGQVAVEHLENGFRAAALEHADAKFGPSHTAADEFRKAQYVRDTLGDYRNVNAIVSAFKAIGGPFVAFRLGIVPKAVGRALTTNIGRQRIESLARTENDVNDPRTGMLKKGAAFELGGPASDYAKLMNPAKLGSYFSSPATSGVIGEAAQLTQQFASGKFNPVTTVHDLARQFVPGASLISGIPEAAASINPYSLQHERLPGTSPLGRALAQMFGSYFREVNPKSERIRRSKLRSSDKLTDKQFNQFQRDLGGK